MAVDTLGAVAQRALAMRVVELNASTLDRLSALASSMKQAVALIEEITAAASADGGCDGSTCPSSRDAKRFRGLQRLGNGVPGSPFADATTFCVRWRGKICRLGNTLSFKLLDWLARRPNRFFHRDVLLREVWENCRSREAVRTAVKLLRRKLTAAGMGDLAAAIDGSTPHHYGLMLDRRNW